MKSQFDSIPADVMRAATALTLVEKIMREHVYGAEEQAVLLQVLADRWDFSTGKRK